MDFNHDTSTIDVSGVSGQTLTISGNGALQLPVGADASRGTASAGKLRWSTTSLKPEVAVDGTNWKAIQFYSAELDGVSALSVTGLVSRTGAGTYASRSIAVPAAGISITNADGVAGNPTLALANDLAGLEGLTTNGIAVRTGTDAWATRTISGTASNISVTNGDGTLGDITIDLVNAGTAITNSLVKITTDAKGRVTASSSVVASDINTALGYTPLNKAGDSLTAGDLTLFQDPTLDMHAATKRYVDQRASGLDPKGSVRAGSDASIPNLSGHGVAGTTYSLGGVTLASGDRVLLKDGASPDGTAAVSNAYNGIYTVALTTTGATGSETTTAVFTRATDADTNAKVTSGMYTFVTEGTHAAQGWILTTPDPITLNTTLLTFAQFNGNTSYTASQGIALSGSDIQTDSTSLLRGLHALAANGILVKTGSNTVANRSIVVPTGMTITNPDGVAGNPTLALANDIGAIEALAGTGLATRTAADTWAQRTITGTANQIVITNGDGVAGNPTIGLSSDPVIPGNLNLILPTGTTAQETGTTDGALRYNSTALRNRQRYNGAWANVGTGDGTVTSVAISGSTGLTVGASPITTSGTITLTLGSELQGLSGLSVNGVTVRTGAGTYANRTVTAGTGISITNGDGVAGNITVSNTGVTSVSLSLPTTFSITTATVTTTGTLTAAWATQTANTVFAGPTTGSAAPTFRALGYTDLPISLFKENPSSPATNVTSGVNSVVIGNGGSATLAGQMVHAGGIFATTGDAQAGNYVLRGITTDAVVKELFLDGTAARLVLPNNSAFMVTVMIVARRTDLAGGSAAHKHEFLIIRDGTAATTAIIGNISKTVVGETNSVWDSTVAADTTNGSFNITVTGEAAKTIRWVARVMTVEVTN